MNTTYYLATLPGCTRCTLTARWLERHGYTYTTVNLAEHPDVLGALKAAGATTAPVVYTTTADTLTIHASGFNPVELAKLAS